MAERCKRCSIEHRTIRKELSKWQKNVALLCGMERVAQELMGGRKWRKLMTPFNCLEQTQEQTQPQDWSPLETCYFCKSKSQSSYDSIESVVPLCDQLSDDKASDDSGDKCSSCGLSNCSCKSSHSPHPNDQPLDLSVHSRHKGSAINQIHSKASETSDNENPLIKVPQPSTPTKAIKRNRLPTNTTWKRTYTEEELSAALRDIQSGKLGTRRAAVIYGIPRSTLRNKVYKLALDRSSNGKRKVSTTPAIPNNTTTSTHLKKLSKSSLLNKSNNNNKNVENVNSALSHMLDNSSTSASESLKQLLKNTITQRANVNNSGGDSAKAKSSESSAQALLSLPGVGLNSMNDLYNCEALATIQLLSTIDCGQALTPLAPLFTQFLLNIALAKRQSEDNCDDITNSMSTSNLPILPDLIRKLAEDQIVQTARTTTSSQSSNQSNGDKSETQPELSGNSNSNVILKVPSYKPKTSSAAVKQSKEEQPNVTTSDTEAMNQLCTSSSHIESDERINDEFESKSFSLKDIIAKSISQRLYNSTSESAPNSSNNVNSEDSSSDALINDDKYDGLNSTDFKNSGNVSDHSNTSTPEKRNRPKRGRYRNYNRDDLAKAVKAVQRGEMSVHRAGESTILLSFVLLYQLIGTLFGVPHSTLEYKVKERHLLRPKKRLNENNTTKKESVNKTNGNTSNRVINGSSGIQAVDSANSMHLPLWQTAFPFLSAEVNNTGNSHNFFASNMMRKLQENARMNEESGKSQSDHNNEYGGLLLESLIKSSLVNNSLNTNSKSENEDNDNEVVNTSLELLKEVSALGKKD